MTAGQGPRLLHLGSDRDVMAFTARLYETAFPGRNQFRIIGVPRGAGPRHVRPGPGVQLVAEPYFFSRRMRADLASCSHLVIHYMNRWFARAALQAPAPVTVVWSAWGRDLYDLLPGFTVHLPETACLLARLNGTTRRAPAGPKVLAHRIWDRVAYRRWEARVLPRIDVASMLPAEHDALSAVAPAFRGTFHPLHYYYSAEHVLNAGPASMTGPDILIGNSASPSNNHVDAFSVVDEASLQGRRVIVPLSYGEDDRYAEEVCRVGRERFGDAFVPLRRFMPLEEYNRTIACCGTVLMNHVRQEAMGTVSAALFKGAKVFLRAASPIFGYYRGMGVEVAAMPGAGGAARSQAAGQPPAPGAGGDRLGEEAWARLPEEARARNHRLLAECWRYDRIVDDVRRLAAAC